MLELAGILLIVAIAAAIIGSAISIPMVMKSWRVTEQDRIQKWKEAPVSHAERDQEIARIRTRAKTRRWWNCLWWKGHQS
jgi:hypothetical protein